MKTSTIAIVGMAGRFPGARNTAEFWRNLRDGVESIRDLIGSPNCSPPAQRLKISPIPTTCSRAAILDDVPLFDASFFGFSPRDASIMDPQHRHFLECAWEALEDAGASAAAIRRLDRRLRRIGHEHLPDPQSARQSPPA